jgi:hypothetical protein
VKEDKKRSKVNYVSFVSTKDISQVIAVQDAENAISAKDLVITLLYVNFISKAEIQVQKLKKK